MRTEDALQIVSNFKGNDLKKRINEIKSNIIGKTKKQIPELDNVYEAALKVKEVSAQINEIVHASGIIKCLPRILLADEKIEDLSLAAAGTGSGIDLVTDKRIAEFKFARWQKGKANGVRRRTAFADLVKLYMEPNPEKIKKELYVFDADQVMAFLTSTEISWKNQLKKSGDLDKKLEDHLLKQGITCTCIKDVYNISNVKVIDVADILNDCEEGGIDKREE